MSRLFLLVLLSTVPCHAAEKSQPCATPFAVIQFDENGTNIGGLGPEDLKWFNSKEQKKYPCLRLQESVTEHTQFGLVIGISRSDSSGTQAVKSTTTSTIHEANCPTCPAVGTVETPTTENVPYSETVLVYKLAVVDFRQNNQPVIHTFFRRQVRQSGGNTRTAMIASLKERHPIEGLLKDALNFISEQSKTR